MMAPFMCLGQITPREGNPVNNGMNEPGNVEIKRKTSFNLEEIKVRWKKAALENCPGVPCIISPPPPSFTCGTSTVSDVDGNAYATVSIGTQCWTVTNLKVTTYNDGTTIPLNNTYTSGTVSTVWQGLTTGAYTIYGNESSTGANATNYGFLYNWYAAKGVSTSGSTTYKNICPTGWHVPTDSDWNKLVKFIDSGADTSSTSLTQSPNAGGKLKSTSTLWNTETPPSPGTDNFGFTGLPGGIRSNVGSFNLIRGSAFFWSATESDFLNAYTRYLDSYDGGAYRNSPSSIKKSVGASVRCLKD
jgi:uncharacterized protein (TIGR02145 family)